MAQAYLTVIVPALITFFVTLAGIKFIMPYFTSAGIIAEDRNKGRPVKVPSSGGLAVAFGIIVGILTYTFGGSFGIFHPILHIAVLLAVALSIMLIAMVGFIDDINVKASRVSSTGMKDIRKGLKQWQKPLLTFLGALPLMAINAGVNHIIIPFIGNLSLGILYPLIVIPLAVIFVSNSFNLLGGFDGLQPGMGVVASFGLVLYSLLWGSYMGLLLSSLLFVAIAAFLPFNIYKARIIPGDSFTYAVGGTLVAIMVMGNAEVFGVIIFMPWIIEFFLHLRRRFNVTDLGIRQRDGTFKSPYGRKTYSLTHLVMNLSGGKATENDISNYLTLLEGGFVVLALLLKLSGVL
jgi:UDP-N-acetylglucosamine--dolichyl-phosphate N-acetylglucosaminephosphotransferase